MTAASASRHATIDELTNQCFGCGPANPRGLQLEFSIDTTDPAHPVSRATIQLDQHHQGAPGFLHGGLIATLLDEAMSKLSRPFGLLAMTRNLNIDYLRPVPLDQPLVITARHLRRDGRKLFHEADVTLPDGTVLSHAKGLFVVLKEQHLSELKD